MNCKDKSLTNTVVSIFEFSDMEMDAIHGFIPMTQELFDACMEKCDQIGPAADPVFFKLLKHHPALIKEYMRTHDLTLD